jgi:hypothetical protein
MFKPVKRNGVVKLFALTVICVNFFVIIYFLARSIKEPSTGVIFALVILAFLELQWNLAKKKPRQLAREKVLRALMERCARASKNF